MFADLHKLVSAGARRVVLAGLVFATTMTAVEPGSASPLPDPVPRLPGLPRPVKPAAPSNVRLTGGTCANMVIAWNDNSSNESGFEITYEITGWNNPVTIRVAANVRSVSIPITKCVECTRTIKVRSYISNLLWGMQYSANAASLTAGVGAYCLW